MKKRISCAVFVFLVLCVMSDFVSGMTKKEGDFEFSLKAEREGSIYKSGETAVFVFRALKNGERADGVNIEWKTSVDGLAPVEMGVAIVKNGEFKISRSADSPCFIKCNLAVLDSPKGKRTTMIAGAGFDPLEIKASMDAPDDFKSYWDSQKELLKKVPLNAKMESVKSGSPEVEAFDVCADSLMGKMTAYYARPQGAKPKSCPAIIMPHGAGVRSSNLANAVGWAKRGFIALDFNAHGIPNGKPKEFYSALQNGELKNYRKYVGKNRDDIPFRGMFLRDVRALDFIKSQPEWDGKILVAYGTSQGGGQVLAAAALDADVTFCVPVVPALCDHSGAAVGRITGWPRYSDVKPNGNYDKELVEKTRYIDAMNFASLIKCPVLAVVGLADGTCAPSSVYAAYSNIKSPKKIVNAEECTHVISKEYYDICKDAILKHAGKK